MAAYPDSTAGVKEVLEGLDRIVELDGEVTMWMERNPDGRVPIVDVQQIGGQEGFPFRWDRIQLDVYAAGRDLARDLCEAAKDCLLRGPHETSVGILDSVDVEVPPRPIPYPHSTVNQFQVLLRVHTRAR